MNLTNDVSQVKFLPVTGAKIESRQGSMMISPKVAIRG